MEVKVWGFWEVVVLGQSEHLGHYFVDKTVNSPVNVSIPIPYYVSYLQTSMCIKTGETIENKFVSENAGS